MNYTNMVREFHESFGHPSCIIPAFPAKNRRNLRIDLIEEEFNELLVAESTNDFIETVDAVADLIYVIVGLAVEYGIPLDKVFSEVHQSNMSKLGADGKPLFRADGKTMKGPNFREPDLRSILIENGWQENA